MDGLPRRFLERLPDAVLHVRVAETAHILACHPAYLPEGLIRQDMAGQPVAAVLPEGAATTLTAACRRALAQQTRVSVVVSLRSTSGRPLPHYLEVHVSPYAGDEVLCLLHDITEQREAEQRLIRRELYLSALTQINHRLLAARGDELPYSEDTLSLLGYAAGASLVYALELAASDAEGLDVRNGLAWTAEGYEAAFDASAPVASLARRLLPRWYAPLRSGRPVQASIAELSAGEAEMLRQQAPGIKVLLLLPVLVEDRVVGLLGFENHGLERRWADDEVGMLQAATVAVSSHIEHTLYVRQLREHAEEIARMNVALAEARDQARVSERAKSEFLAVMSHEMRTPLNAVISMTEMLRRTELSERQQRFADLTHEAGMSLLDRINTILDYVEVQAGSLVPHEVIFSPAAVARSVVELYEGRAQEKGLNLGVHLDPGLPATVFGDAIRVRQVLTALVDNAVKFTDRGEVMVRVVAEARAGEPASDRVVLRFSVADTGIGLDPRARDELFEPFVQADTSSTRRYNGSGLGLALAKRIVTSLGGDLEVRSRPREGSTFWFTVDVARSPGPVAEGAVGSALTERAALGDAVPTTPDAEEATDLTVQVLLVETNAILRRLAAQELERQGCRVSAVATPAEAQRALRVVTCVDVVLIELPSDAGGAPTIEPRAFEGLLATVSRGCAEGQPRPLLVGLTGQPGRASQAACEAAGIDLCVAKPLTSTAIRDLLSRRSA